MCIRDSGKTWLGTAADSVKDQTDFLAQIDYLQVSKLMFPLGRQKDTSLLLEADNKAELIQQLRLHPTAVVILDYTCLLYTSMKVFFR